MQKLNFKLNKPETRYDLVSKIAGKLNRPIGQLLGLTRNWTHEGLDNIYRSSVVLSKDKDMPFEQSFWWHYNEVKKQL